MGISIPFALPRPIAPWREAVSGWVALAFSADGWSFHVTGHTDVSGPKRLVLTPTFSLSAKGGRGPLCGRHPSCRRCSQDTELLFLWVTYRLRSHKDRVCIPAPAPKSCVALGDDSSCLSLSFLICRVAIPRFLTKTDGSESRNQAHSTGRGRCVERRWEGVASAVLAV